MKRDIKSDNIHKYMFRTYVVIVAVAMILECMVYAYMIYNTNSYMEVTHESELSKLKYELDHSMNNVITQTNSLSHNAKVQNLLSVKFDKYYYGADMESVKEVMDSFQNIKEYYPQINNISLLDYNHNTIITQSNIYHNEQYDSYLNDEMGIDAALFETILDGLTDSIFVVGSGTDDCKVYCIKNIYVKSYRVPAGILLTEYSMDYYQEILSAFETSESTFYFWTDSFGNYAGTTEDEKNLIKEIIFQDKESGNIEWAKQNCVYSTMKSDISGVMYYYISSYYGFYRIVVTTLIFIVINLLLLVGVGLFLAKRFAADNSKPLYQIMDMLEPQQGRDQLFSYNQLVSGVSELAKCLQDLRDS